jgi:hypothetical protein
LDAGQTTSFLARGEAARQERTREEVAVSTMRMPVRRSVGWACWILSSLEQHVGAD